MDPSGKPLTEAGTEDAGRLGEDVDEGKTLLPRDLLSTYNPVNNLGEQVVVKVTGRRN